MTTPLSEVEALAAIQRLKTEIRDLDRDILTLEGDAKTAAEEKLRLAKEERTAIEKSTIGLKLRADLIQDEIRDYETLLNTRNTLDGNERKSAAQKRIANAQEEAHQKWLEVQVEYMNKMSLEGHAINEDLLKDYEAQLDELEQMPRYLQESADLAQQIGNSMATYAKHPFFNAANMAKIAGSIKAGPKEFFANFAKAAIFSVVDSMIGLIFEMNKAEASFTKTTGASESFKASMRGVYEEARYATVSMEQFYQSTGELYQAFTDFTQISVGARQEVALVTSTMVQAGHSAGSLAKDMQLLTVAFGHTATEASETLMELDAFARDIGVPPAQLTEQFGAMGSSLAKLGVDGVDAFKDLARVSKITGFEMGKLLRMTDKFDTFEGAAEQAGKLNAALGGNFVNAMDMMTATDPVERFEMMRNSLLDAGLEFDKMSYYQRKFFAESMGLEDVSDLAAMMRGDMESLDAQIGLTGDQYEDMADRAREAADFQERFKAVMMRLIPVLTPVIDAIDMMLSSVEELNKGTKKFSPEAKAMKSTLEGLLVPLKALGSFLLAIITHWEWALAAFVAFKVVFGIIIPLLGSTAGGWAALATALNLTPVAKLLAIAAGFSIMALSVAAMGYAFSQMSIEQMAGLAATLVLLGVGIYFLSPAIAAIGAAATATAPGLWTLAAVIVAIGAAVGLAAWGVGKMAEGFGVMFKSIDPNKMLAFSLFVGVLALASYIMPAIGVGLGLLGAGILILWAAMALMPQAKVDAFTDFLNTFQGDVDLAKMDAVIDRLKQVKNAMNDIPLAKTVAVTAMTNAMMAPLMVGATASALMGKGGSGGSGGGGMGAQQAVINATIPVYLDKQKIASALYTTVEEIRHERMMAGLSGRGSPPLAKGNT